MRKILFVLLAVFALPALAFAQPSDVRAAADSLIAQGYFVRCERGDDRACSYFTRLLVYTVNPSGNTNHVGALRKGGGKNFDGYAEDALATNANPSDLFNVYDIVGGAGAPGASFMWDGPKVRRPSDTWEAPKPLSAAELSYLRPGSAPSPTPTTPAPAPLPPPAPTVNLQPVLDALARITSLLEQLHAKVDADGSNDAFVRDTLQRIDENAHAAAVRAQWLVEAKPTAVDFPEYVGRLGPTSIVLRPRK